METLVFKDRKSWRGWLRLNHMTRKEVWLILPKRSAGGESYRAYYNRALEEAICFGWIDSRIRPVDDARSMVRFTPRKGKSWSSYNLKRAQALIMKGVMTEAGLKVLPQDIVRQTREETRLRYRAKRKTGRAI